METTINETQIEKIKGEVTRLRSEVETLITEGIEKDHYISTLENAIRGCWQLVK